MAGYTLNVDHWDWVDPETQKVHRLRRGDDVPAGVLDQEGIDVEEMSSGRAPQLLKKHSAEGEQARAEGTTPAATAQTQASSPPPPNTKK